MYALLCYFPLLVFVILSLVCTGIYYFSYEARINNIKVRLTNRAITTGRLLSQQEIFDRNLIKRSIHQPRFLLIRNSVQAYNYQNKRIYNYIELPGDTLHIDAKILDNARVKGSLYFTEGEREVVAYHYTDNNSRFVDGGCGKDVQGKESLQNPIEDTYY